MLGKRRLSPTKKVQTTKVVDSKAISVAESKATTIAKATNIAESKATTIVKEPYYSKDIFTEPTESENSDAIDNSSDGVEQDGSVAKKLKFDSDS